MQLQPKNQRPDYNTIDATSRKLFKGISDAETMY